MNGFIQLLGNVNFALCFVSVIALLFFLVYRVTR